MGLFSRFEDKAESVIEGGSGRGKGGIEPVKIAKRAFKEMQREKMVGVGHEYAPTLYNVLVSPEDDAKMSGYYPSLAGEIETFLVGKAKSAGLVFDCAPLIRFIIDDGLKRGRFDIIAENVSPAIIADLREEEMEHYGLKEPELFPMPAPQPQSTPERVRGYDALTQGSEPDTAFEPAYEASGQQFAPTPYAQELPVETPQAYDEPQASTPSYDASWQAEPFASPQIPVAEQPAAEPVVAAAAVQAAPVAERIYPPTEPPAADAQPQAASLARESADRTVFLGATPAPAIPQATLYDFSTQVSHVTNGERTIIGRGTSCDIVISNPSVSRRHAEILHDESGWLIRDTGSTNGTNVNGARATQARLYTGDIITVGTTDLEFREG